MEKAYMIMAHKDPKQLHRLVARLNDGRSEFFIHIDKKVEINPFEILTSFGEVVHFIERFDASWGGLGTIKPFLAGMKAIQKAKKKFDRILLLSGQDYPIKSNADIDNFFKNARHSVFVNHFPIPNYKKWPGSDRGGWYRVDKYYFGQKWYHFMASKSLNFASTYLPFFKRKLPDGMKPYTGQTWWNLDMYALNYILDYHEKHPEYIAFHKNTFVADELFVQMILMNSQDDRLLKSIENSEKRLSIWDKADSPHPNILRKTDLQAILTSTDLFARKFDENVDSEILDLIDEKVLNWNGAFHKSDALTPGKVDLEVQR
jgi:hypothetical protein